MKKIYDYVKTHEAEIKEALTAFIEKTNGKDEVIGMTYDGKEKYGYADEHPEIVWTHVCETYNIDADEAYKEYVKRLRKLMKVLENGYVEIRPDNMVKYYCECMVLINEAQKRCSARTLNWYTFCDAIGKVQTACPIKAKTHCKGLRFHIDPNGQKFPTSYKYTPESTRIVGEFTQNGIKVSFERWHTNRNKEPEFSGFSEDQILYILKSAGVDTYYTERAFNYYKNNAKCKIWG